LHLCVRERQIRTVDPRKDLEWELTDDHIRPSSALAGLRLRAGHGQSATGRRPILTPSSTVKNSCAHSRTNDQDQPPAELRHCRRLAWSLGDTYVPLLALVYVDTQRRPLPWSLPSCCHVRGTVRSYIVYRGEWTHGLRWEHERILQTSGSGTYVHHVSSCLAVSNLGNNCPPSL
jgi:hypothetical protein